MAAFYYIDKSLISLSAQSRRVCIISPVSVVGAPTGVAGTSFTLIFSTRTIKNLLSITENKKKKHNKILRLTKNKLNSIETLVSQVLVDREINYEKFITILKEKDKCEKIKENVRSKNLKQENMWLNSVNSKI